MKDEFLKAIRKRMDNQAERDELLDDALERVGRKVKEAFRVVGREAQTLSDVSVAAGEIVALALAELDVHWRVQVALQWSAWMCLLKELPEDARKRVEHELKTVTIDELLP